MKKSLILTILIVAFSNIFFSNQLDAKNTDIKIPNSRGYVSDFANIMPNSRTLGHILSQVERETSIEIAVVTLNSTTPYTIEQYAVKMFKEWKIGKRGKDNGILLLVAKNDKKVRIEVGYGLEHILNDAKCGDIIRKAIIPFFKQGNYEKGIFAGVNYLGKALNIRTYSNVPIKKHKRKAKSSLFSVLLLISLIALRSGFLPYMLFGRTYYRNHYWGTRTGSGGFSSGSFGGFSGGSSGGGGASGSW